MAGDREKPKEKQQQKSQIASASPTGLPPPRSAGVLSSRRARVHKDCLTGALHPAVYILETSEESGIPFMSIYHYGSVCQDSLNFSPHALS